MCNIELRENSRVSTDIANNWEHVDVNVLWYLRTLQRHVFVTRALQCGITNTYLWPVHYEINQRSFLLWPRSEDHSRSHPASFLYSKTQPRVKYAWFGVSYSTPENYDSCIWLNSWLTTKYYLTENTCIHIVKHSRATVNEAAAIFVHLTAKILLKGSVWFF